MTTTARSTDSPWPHRLAVLLVCAVFPLIWVGGLVTTYNAGMSVYDWPTTFGFQPLGYPLGTWIFGPFDIFVEHGHRLLGMVAGIVAIALVISAWRCRAASSIQKLAGLALVAICVQGVLGGLRVLLDRRQLAMIHGCVGPACFALCVVVATVSSTAWRNAVPLPHVGAGGLHAASLLMIALAYVQLVLGASVRHVSDMAAPDSFRVAVLGHVVLAGVLAIFSGLLAARVWVAHRKNSRLAGWSLALLLLVIVQIGLGTWTWIAKYGWPFGEFADAQPIIAHSMAQALKITAHVATGSLILAVSVVLALWSQRLVILDRKQVSASAPLTGATA